MYLEANCVPNFSSLCVDRICFMWLYCIVRWWKPLALFPHKMMYGGLGGGQFQTCQSCIFAVFFFLFFYLSWEVNTHIDFKALLSGGETWLADNCIKSVFHQVNFRAELQFIFKENNSQHRSMTEIALPSSVVRNCISHWALLGVWSADPHWRCWNGRGKKKHLME